VAQQATQHAQRAQRIQHPGCAAATKRLSRCPLLQSPALRHRCCAKGLQKPATHPCTVPQA
jgi:hypothetical protein